MTEKQTEVIAKLVLSGMVCALGGAAIYLTAGAGGFGWVILGLIVIWNW